MGKAKKLVKFRSWDWRENPWENGSEKNSLKNTLEKFGVYIYEDPITRGMDCYGVIFSNKPLTEKEIIKETKKEYSYDKELTDFLDK